jgi:hypothetical protein
MRITSFFKSRIKGDGLHHANQSPKADTSPVRRVVFEGGLGSQLIPLLEKNYLSFLNIPFSVDTSYFDINQKISKSRGRADHWSYRLDFYGITLDSLLTDSVPINSQTDLAQGRNFDLWNSDFWRYVRNYGAVLLPINFGLLQNFKDSIGIGATEAYSVIHVRRGDYLRVASHIVTDSMWLGFIEKIKSITSGVLVITSDSTIPKKTKGEVARIFRHTSTRVIYLEGQKIDECILHDFMRSANVLVASNSTYSFTAAVLSNPKTFCVVPSIFYVSGPLEIFLF